MGRRASTQSTDMYNLVQSTIDGMEIGDLCEIAMPADLALFRKYISEIGKRMHRKFRTRTVDNKLEVFRVKYSNIYSKEVE